MLREEIKLKLNEALKNKDKKCTSTLRLVLAAIKDRDIAARSKGNNSGISEDSILGNVYARICRSKNWYFFTI